MVARLLLITVFVTLIGITQACGWGQTGHRAVNTLVLNALRSDARKNLPGAHAALQLLERQSFLFITEADLPDVAVQSDTSQQPDHFMDLEDFGNPDFVRALPAVRPATVPEMSGQLPWVVGQYTRALRAAWRAGRTVDALRAAIYLAHFAADAHTPLHATRDFNGRSAASKGIHSRWESDLVEAMTGLDTIAVSPERDWTLTAGPVPAAALQRVAEQAAARALETSWLLVDGVYAADAAARQAAGWQDGVPASWSATDDDALIYLREMQRAQGETVQSRLAESARFIADLMTAAAAGGRALPAARLDEVRLDKNGAETAGDTCQVTLLLTRLATATNPDRYELQARDAAHPAGPPLRTLPVTIPHQAGDTAVAIIALPRAALAGIARLEIRLAPDDAVSPWDNRVFIRRKDWE